MTCFVTGCTAELWRQDRLSAEADAKAAGWRFMADGKTPELSAGVALCAAHVDQAEKFRPAPPAKARVK